MEKQMKHICQGPECHTYKTQSRIRGVKGSKVLRTRAARYDMTTHSWGYIWERYFCDERCMQNWLAKHMTHLMTVVGINTKPQETPIVVEKETYERESDKKRFNDRLNIDEKWRKK